MENNALKSKQALLSPIQGRKAGVCTKLVRIVFQRTVVTISRPFNFDFFFFEIFAVCLWPSSNCSYDKVFHLKN